MGTNILHNTLASVLFGKTRRSILGLLLCRPDEAFYLREISSTVGTGQGAAQRELERFEQVGIVTKFAKGRHVYYQANRACPIFVELAGLIRKTVGLADILREAMTPLQSDILAAFVYGSQATGDATANSDVDLVVIADVDDMALHQAITNAENQLTRSVNYMLMSPDEFAARRKEAGGFVDRILSGATIPIIGDVDEI